jgi:hypothetical protein
MELWRDFRDWIFAVLKVWYGWLPSSALAALVGYLQNIRGWNPGPRTYIGILTLGFLFSTFVAWRKERVENRTGPEIVIEWESSHPWNQDVVRFRNLGKSAALLVEMGDFSWPELSWHRRIVIQSLYPGSQPSVMVAEFNEEGKAPNDNYVGHLGHVLDSTRYANRKPLSVDVTFSDQNGTKFTRSFILRRGTGGTTSPGVLIEMGKLKMTRA